MADPRPTVHLTQHGTTLTRCCDRTLLELPALDRLTPLSYKATCAVTL